MIRNHLRTNLIGYLALFVALSAGAYAAGVKKNSVTSKSIRDGQIKLSDLGANSVDSSKVVDGSLAAADFGGALPPGPQGPVGPQGLQGPQGPQGPAGSPDSGAEILTKLDGVDGAGSGLDADYLDGLSSILYVKSGDDAGGDLSGQYPSPGIADGAVGVDEHASLPAARVDTPLATCEGGAPAVPGDGTIVALGYRDEDFDSGGLHTASPCESRTRLTAPRSGIYQITAGVTWSHLGSGGNPSAGTRFAGIRLNGNDNSYVTASRVPGLGGGSVPEQPLTTLVRMQAGQYAEVMVAQDSGGEINLDPGFERQSFQMVWIAPG